MSFNPKQTKKPKAISKQSHRIKGSLSLTSEENKLIDIKKKKGETFSKTFTSFQLKPNHFRHKSFHVKKPEPTQSNQHHRVKPNITKSKSQTQPQPQTQTETNNHQPIKHDDLNQEFTFAETFNIISEIQYQFENSLKENKKPISEIKRLIDNDLNIYNYINLSEEQKDNISKDIDRSSELRIQNYANVFKYIQSSLEGINDCLQTMVNQDETSEDYDEYNQIEDDDENEMIETSEDFLTPEANTKRKESHKANADNYDGDNCDLEESDFSAGVMLENALVLPPKSSPFNYQCGKDITRMRSKKFSVKKNPLATNTNSQSIKHSSNKQLNKINTNANANTVPINSYTIKNDKENDNAKEDKNELTTMQNEELAMLASSVEKINKIDKEKGCFII